MKPKVMLIFALLSMVIVSVSHAAVTVSIDGPYTKAAGDTITIPVTISGYTGHYAAQFVVDFGKIQALTPTISTQSGDIYSAVVDYSGYTLKSQWDAVSKWYETKDAAIDYQLFGSKLKIYLVSPKSQSEKAGSESGTLFTIQATIGTNPKPDIIMFGGEVLNNNPKETAYVGSSAIVNIQGLNPVSVISSPADLTGKTAEQLKNVTDIIDVGALGGSIPDQITAVTLKNEDYTVTKEVGLELKGGTEIKKADGTTYSGFLKPPEAKSYSELSKEEQDALPDAWKGYCYKISVGAAEKLKLSKEALMLLKVRLKTESPMVYYLPDNGAPEKAGVDGSATVEGKAYNIKEGGTIIGQATASGGTDYTIAVLLNHLSTFVVGPPLPTAASTPVSGDGGICFIATAAFGSPNDWHVRTLRQFRDSYLLTSDWGRAFVNAYYKHSPPIATYLAEHDVLRAVVRMALVPVAGFAYVTMYQPVLLLIGFVMVLGFVGILIRKKVVSA